MTKRNQISIVVLAFAILIGAGLFWNMQKRMPAAKDRESLKLESAQIKTAMIQSIEWTDQADQTVFRISSADADFCKKWQLAEVHLSAEGMGVSGEAPAAMQSTKCVDGRFEMIWPKDLKQWKEGITKIGDYLETPSQMYVSQILIEGPFGQMHISAYEISAIRNAQFELPLVP